MLEGKRPSDSIIFEAAKRVFLKKGLDGARMQEIADEAGMNKASLHYYYRSKHQLYLLVVQDLFGQFFPKLFKLFNIESSFKDRIEDFFVMYLDFLIENPLIPQFVITEMVRQPDILKDLFLKPKEIGLVKLVDGLIKEGVEQGDIVPISSEDFVLNLISLAVFPIIARPIFSEVLEMDENSYDSFLQQRKKTAANFFLNALT